MLIGRWKIRITTGCRRKTNGEEGGKIGMSWQVDIEVT